jgi:cytochrome c
MLQCDYTRLASEERGNYERARYRGARVPDFPEIIVDSFEWNKIAGWTLAAAMTVLALVLFTGEIFHPGKLAKPGYIVEGVEEVAAAGPAAVAEKPIEFFLASASPDKGAEVFKKCGACHNAEKGGANGIGPNLYGVVGGPHDHLPGYAYSDAMQKTSGEKWDWDSLNKWLTNPKGYVAGTKMAFAGLGKEEERAAVIAYLNSKSDHPLPIPPVPADAAPTAAPPAATAAADTPSPAVTPTADKPAPQPGKAPDVDPAATPAAK